MTDLPASTAPAAAAHPLVQGRCPACRGASLFLGSGGYITCSRLDCPNPTAADDLLHGEQPASEAALARVRKLIADDPSGIFSDDEIRAALGREQPAPAPAATQATEPCTGQCDPTTGAFTHAVTCHEDRERTGRNASLHRFTVAPRDPEAEQAAEQRAREMADQHEKTARVFAALPRSAEDTVTRVITLYEQWVKAGAPPLGTSMSRWWNARLAELHDAIQPPAVRQQTPDELRERADTDDLTTKETGPA